MSMAILSLRNEDPYTVKDKTSHTMKSLARFRMELQRPLNTLLCKLQISVLLGQDDVEAFGNVNVDADVLFVSV